MVALIPAVLAHQGGWDETLLVVGPLAFIYWLLRLAKRRAAAAPTSTEPAEPAEPTMPVDD